MKTRILVVLLSVAVSLFMILILTAYSQEDIVVLNDPAFENSQRPPSLFRHEEHNELAEIYECNECHHVYEDGVKLEDESSEDEACSDCHGLQKSGEIPALMKAYHMNCKGCHLDRGKGPIMCGECHVRGFDHQE